MGLQISVQVPELRFFPLNSIVFKTVIKKCGPALCVATKPRRVRVCRAPVFSDRTRKLGWDTPEPCYLGWILSCWPWGAPHQRPWALDVILTLSSSQLCHLLSVQERSSLGQNLLSQQRTDPPPDSVRRLDINCSSDSSCRTYAGHRAQPQLLGVALHHGKCTIWSLFCQIRLDKTICCPFFSVLSLKIIEFQSQKGP